MTREAKNPNEHGTVVTVSRLRADIVSRLQSSQEIRTIRATLGRIYTYMLRTVDPRISGASLMGGRGMGLFVNNKRVKAVWPCIWDPSRTVPYMGTSIPAFEQIDIPLSAAWACMDCGHWHTFEPDVCTECGGVRLEKRERRIWGWVGIQRYIDNSDFGLSFFRQGRSIVTQDKGLFEWESPEGTKILEYPVELGQGRMVGEIHLDHAPVNFRKTDFDRSSQAWMYMAERIRGEAPLKPQSAKRLGYAPNTSPLASLFNGYRRNEAGLKHLIPGDGHNPLNAQAKKWAEEFRNGTPGYESDEKWYAAAKRHTEAKSGEKDPQTSDDESKKADDDWFKNQGLDPDDTAHDGSNPTPTGDQQDDSSDQQTPETEDQRFARYKEHARLLPELDGKIRIGAMEAQVRAYVTDGVPLLRDGVLGAPFTVRLNHGVTEVFLDSGHPLVAGYGWSPFNAIIVSAAPYLRSIYQYPRPLDDLIIEMLAQFPDQKVEPTAIRNRAGSLLEQMRDGLAPLVNARPETYWNALRPSSRRGTEEVASKQAPEIDWAASVKDGGYSPFLTVPAIRDLLVAQPADLLDGSVFTGTYQGWLDEDTRQGAVDRIAVLLDDLRVMLSPTLPSNPRELNRLHLSADILAAELVTV